MKREERYKELLAWFSRSMPDAKSELNYSNPFELLVAVVLSAQCTDKRVNLTTPALFAKYPDAAAMAGASVEEIYSLISSISFPNNKALHLSQMAKKLLSDFGGEVPSGMEELQTLPGVGRKTANVVRAVAFNIPAMPVDTHVFRVAARIGLSEKAKTPDETERQLVSYIPKEMLADAHHWILLHGRYVCTARKPKCNECGVSKWCKSYSSSSKV
ncbi:MAG: endonuclease III [Marinifilaceae bacterium]|nr:endonuclease III [Marinifilaceae bacterium]